MGAERMSIIFAIVLLAMAMSLLIAALAMVNETLDNIPNDPHEAAALTEEWRNEKETP